MPVFLQMDIEGSEVEMLKEWTKTGLLKRVKQVKFIEQKLFSYVCINIYFCFTDRSWVPRPRQGQSGKILWHCQGTLSQRIQGENGIRFFLQRNYVFCFCSLQIISWEPNLSVPAKQPFLMPFFEIVFRRADVQHCGIRLWPNAFEN